MASPAIKRKSEHTSGPDSKKPKGGSITAFFGAPKPKPASTQSTSTPASRSNNFDKQKWVSSLTTEQKELLQLEIDTLDESWLAHLKDELTSTDFLNLKRFLKKEKDSKVKVFPPEEDIYSWSRHTPLHTVKVVIIGQDPYHNHNQAHGLCFSVRAPVRAPPSLVNIYKGIKVDYPDFEAPPDKGGLLIPWAERGVLMLNTCLTVRAHQANSHSNKGWEKFTQKVIDLVARVRTNGVVFLAWGRPAGTRVAKINKEKHCILQSVHPSPLSAHNGFFQNGHFKKCNDWLALRYGEDEMIDWSLVPSQKAPSAPKCVSDKENSTTLANKAPIEANPEVKIQPVKVDEFDDDEAIEALVAAEAKGVRPELLIDNEPYFAPYLDLPLSIASASPSNTSDVMKSAGWNTLGLRIFPSPGVALEPYELVPLVNDQRHKRCRHLIPKWEPLNTTPLSPPQLHQYGPDSLVNTDGSNHGRSPAPGHLDRVRTASDSASTSSVPAAGRFVGDLNPESLIRERLDEPTGNPQRGRIGLWINSPAAHNAKPRSGWRAQAVGKDSTTNIPSQTARDSQTVALLLHQRFAAGIQACEQLPLAMRLPLSAIYFSKVNHIVPIVDREFLDAQAEDSASVFLEKAICLTAAKTPMASPYLRLVPDGPVLPSRQFCSEIYEQLVVAMDTELEPDRLTRIRVLALMSLHCEGHEGAEAASLHLCQAIHQAQTVGLHLDRPNQTSTDSLSELFWCLWTLDKMHACIGGRPVLLADRDIGLAKPKVNAKSRRAFGVWLSVSELLATVISFYRPSAESSAGWEEGFPSFEDITGEDTLEDLDFATLAFLELYYHSVAILSCRSRHTEDIDSTRLSSVRQGLAAIRIHALVASECTEDLPPLPIVPYAITLSMGVSYRQLRSSRLITHINRAKASLEACRSLLENLSPYWYSAEGMARLGQRALDQIQGQLQSSRTDRVGPQRHVTVPAHKQPGPNDSMSKGLETTHFAPPGNEFPRAKRQRSSSHGMANVSTAADVAIEPLHPPMSDVDTHVPNGLADIDTLFGEFLDISLPTNFWDPIFMEESREQTDDPRSKSSSL
ncbi:Uracil-DNA glycosylase [Penicillium bovifimosum]|uniref:Uracil-DNA glycosylase n=1 Tax=Penicillium bovifimosum TaxID=126998 RepID=A0A9W9KU95_9EURO|nr:Uracil-DNA glycosylase [Penicillium bovifimosum]KAJ5121206.1 Uracil-DNA glycosylase [Penicillium bovifimosum]